MLIISLNGRVQLVKMLITLEHMVYLNQILHPYLSNIDQPLVFKNVYQDKILKSQ